MNIKQVLRQATQTLTATSSSAVIDAELLLLHALQQSRIFLYSHPEYTLTPKEAERFEQYLMKRKEGIPIAYILGIKEFWSLPLAVNNHTLIPRPDTELLVSIVLEYLPNKVSSEQKILDLGTGSGAIALALAKERPDWEIVATDVDSETIDTAAKNSATLKLRNVSFIESHWFEHLPKTIFSAIVSNPPYIAEGDPHLTQGDLRFEPQHALTSGFDGLDALRIIIRQSRHYLRPGGFLLVEHGYDQKQSVQSLFSKYGYKDIQSYQDIQGHDRATLGYI